MATCQCQVKAAGGVARQQSDPYTTYPLQSLSNRFYNRAISAARPHVRGEGTMTKVADIPYLSVIGYIVHVYIGYLRGDVKIHNRWLQPKCYVYFFFCNLAAAGCLIRMLQPMNFDISP